MGMPSRTKAIKLDKKSAKSRLSEVSYLVYKILHIFRIFNKSHHYVDLLLKRRKITNASPTRLMSSLQDGISDEEIKNVGRQSPWLRC